MKITPGALDTQARRARAIWPFIAAIEADHRLPYGLLFGVGSRETNLVNTVGDGGHGHGIWQLDDRSHRIPDGFDSDPETQAHVAASMLATLLLRNSPIAALNRYNSGKPATSSTTGGDYGPEVCSRTTWIAHHVAPTQLGALEFGSMGADVAAWQRQMTYRGWKLRVDGIFGHASYAVCVAFQREKGLTADGVVGPATWAASWALPVT